MGFQTFVCCGGVLGLLIFLYRPTRLPLISSTSLANFISCNAHFCLYLLLLNKRFFFCSSFRAHWLSLTSQGICACADPDGH